MAKLKTFYFLESLSLMSGFPPQIGYPTLSAKNVFCSIILSLSIGIATSSFGANHSASSRIETLEKEITNLKKQNQKTTKSHNRLKENLKDYIQRLHINGFLSAGLSQSNRDISISGASNDLSTLARGKMGLQTTFRMGPWTEAVVQVLGRASSDDWNLNTQWAYLGHNFQNGFEIQTGRFRTLSYQQSEVLDVGFAYPWVTPPVDVYGSLPFENLDGIGVIYRSAFGRWAGKLKSFYGNNTENTPTFTVNNRDLFAVRYNISDEYWDIALVYGEGKSELTFKDLAVFNVDETKAVFYGFGLNYDAERWFLMSEFTRREVDTAILSDYDAYYITMGWRIGNETIHITYGGGETRDDDTRTDLLAELFNLRQTTYSLGLRHEVAKGIAAKIEVWYITDLEGTNGNFEFNTPEVGQPILHGTKDATVFNLTVDMVF